ncbi:hypothetical protein AOQ84DRAFT_361265 [Glonium stellatum]|uniref:Prolyl 4-hydroxylase alpha subunit domain-containing protein n=1 Tax=Glonium stellatum TaxID=574774 RepID=A0A8E2JW18_9PEZI|nr:hypothetical protein AOQ84DRAFT_361265 [Glonium stellatum]
MPVRISRPSSVGMQVMAVTTFSDPGVISHEPGDSIQRNSLTARIFQCSTYLEAKALIINNYLQQIGVVHVVVRASQDVASLVTLAILVHAARMEKSPIRSVIAIKDLSMREPQQLNATSRFSVSSSILNENEKKLQYYTVDATLRAGSVGRVDEAEAGDGQVSSTLYIKALEFFNQGYPAIVCGRTDFAKDGVVNFWGNNGQGLFDMQIISDLHHREVVDLSHYLQIPVQCSHAPTSRLAEEFKMRCIYRRLYQERMDSLQPQCRDGFPRAGDAIHLSVMLTSIPGAWTMLRAPRPPNDLAISKMQAQRMILPTLTKRLRSVTDTVHQIDEVASIRQLNDLLSSPECGQIMQALKTCSWRGSDIHGKPIFSMEASIGSLRTSVYDTSFAADMWQRLQPILPPVEVFNETHPLTDTQGSRVWYPIGVSPLFRFMQYDGDKGLVPHYDAPYVESEYTSTLYSLVIYLNTNGSGGTRFYSDRQRHLPFDQRNFADQQLCAERVLKEFLPTTGQAIIFPHRLLHDSAPLLDGYKFIIRTDIIFRRCCSNQQAVATAVAGAAPTGGQIRIADPHYLSASERYTPAELVQAGYLPVRRQEVLETNWLSTPFDKAIRGLQAVSQEQTRDPLVIFSTGCYNPPHAGHIHILEVAKRALESRGHPVIAGYLVPAHQSYVDEKTTSCPGRHASLTAPDRLFACGSAVTNAADARSWLDVDPYELLYGRCDVNFTATQHRLELYLRRHVSDQVRLVYVFGGDNASFARVYWKKGLAVCVNRPEYEESFRRFRAEIMGEEKESNNGGRENRILWLEDLEESIDVASSAIRRNSPKVCVAEALSMQESSVTAERRTFRLRLESELNRPFTLSLAALIESHIPFCTVHLTTIPSQVAHLSSVLASLRSAQQQENPELKNPRPIETISLDALIPGTYTLAVSRLYPLCDISQATITAPSTLIPRPGSPDIPIQLSRIPSGPDAPPYLLFDDDVYTGTTMRRAIAVLTSTGRPLSDRTTTRTILSTLSLTPATPRPLDIADARDFLLGAPHGGLVVTLPSGLLARAPYVLPYVSPSARASIPRGRELAFSRAVWALNVRYYEEKEEGGEKEGFSVGDVDKWAGALLRAVGFRDEDEMVVVCKWHLRRLEELME